MKMTDKNWPTVVTKIEKLLKQEYGREMDYGSVLTVAEPIDGGCQFASKIMTASDCPILSGAIMGSLNVETAKLIAH